MPAFADILRPEADPSSVSADPVDRGPELFASVVAEVVVTAKFVELPGFRIVLCTLSI